MTTPAPPPSPPKSRPAAPPAPAPTAKQVGHASSKTFDVSEGPQGGPERVVCYGPGGIGKSELPANAKQLGMDVVSMDIEQSTERIDIARIRDVTCYEDVVAVLTGHSRLERADIIVVDSLTKLEEFCTDYVLRTTKNDKGNLVDGIEKFGFGKGYSYTYEAFNRILGMLDAWSRKGKHIVCTAHECVSNVPNPYGDDWKRYEPRLQSQNNGNIRSRCKEWATQVWFIGFDVHVGENRKATGAGTRRIYTSELPTHLAKNREFPDEGVGFAYEHRSADIWKKLFGKE